MSNNEKDQGKFVSMYGGKLGYTQNERDAVFAALKSAVAREPHKFWAFLDTADTTDYDEEVQDLLAQLEITAAKAT